MSRCVNTVRLKNIKNKIMYKLEKILQKVREHKINIHDGKDQILSLMGEKEIGGSGALPSDGDLHGVRECNVSGADSDKEASVNGSLEKRTDTENFCSCDLPIPQCDFNGTCFICHLPNKMRTKVEGS